MDGWLRIGGESNPSEVAGKVGRDPKLVYKRVHKGLNVSHIDADSTVKEWKRTVSMET